MYSLRLPTMPHFVNNAEITFFTFNLVTRASLQGQGCPF